jgi:predicted TIM-barrel fold metal-dependent hydrolase
MTIDAHLHLWVNDPDQYPWDPIGGYVPEKEAPLSDFIEVTEKNQISGAVLVQPTPYGWDNSYLLDCKKVNPKNFKAVVLVNPLVESAPEDLNMLVEQGADGLRINLHLNPVEEYQNSAFLNLIEQCGLLRLPICLQLTPRYHDLLAELSAKYPVKFVIDHLGRPAAGSSAQGEQFKKLLNLSSQPNVFIKLTGMNYYSKIAAPYPDTWSLLRAAKEHFGADHCLWGSDYPFIQEHWSYGQNINLFREELLFTEYDLDWIMEKTARSLWWQESTE